MHQYQFQFKVQLMGKHVGNWLGLIVLLWVVMMASSQKLTVDSLNSYLMDSKGRYVFYHGVNVVEKQFPYYPNTEEFDPMDSLSEKDLRDLKSWGMNAIRLFISWQGFEPVEGQYNYTYLEKVKGITQAAKEHGIAIILDAHQDLFSRRFCGEGFPDWLFTTKESQEEGYYQVRDFPAPLKVELRRDERGNPLKEDCLKLQFFKYYLARDVMRFSEAFFRNENGMGDKFNRMWLNVVGYFKGEDNVIGYDLINEPSGGNLWKNPYDYIGPGVNSNKYLLPFYEKLAAEIRKVDQEKLILFEPFPVDFVGGFYHTPSPKEYKNLDVLSYHTYCPLVNEHAEPISDSKCHLIDSLVMQNRHRNIKGLQCGSMMTEFGSVPQSESGLQEIRRVLGIAEAYWQSWFWWQFKYYNDFTCTGTPPWEQSFYFPNGTLQQDKVTLLAHPYAYFVCGTPISQSSAQNSYTLSFRPKECGGSATEIYLNEDMYFKNGFTVSFSPACQDCYLESVGRQRSYYKVVVVDGAMHSDLEVRVAGNI